MSRVGQLIGEMMGRAPARRSKAAPGRRKFLFEPLDPRLLLSATPFYSAAGAQAAVQLTVQLGDINGQRTLQVIDAAKGVVASTTALDGRAGLSIIGSGFDDTLTLASDLSALRGRISFDGGGGRDTLAGPLLDTTWNVTAANAGNVRGLQFSQVGTLQGAAGNQDSFVFSASGALSGRADGGAAGFDAISLVGGSFATTAYTSFDPTSGTIARDDNLLTYAGMEPITDLTVTANRVFNGVAGQANNITLSYDSAASLMVFASNTSETVNFVAPTATLSINGQGTTDTIALNGVAPVFNAQLLVNGNSTVSSAVSFTGAIATGNRIAVGSTTDITVAANITTSSNIQLSATRSITVANNVALSAGTAGVIQMNVSKTQDLVWNRNVAGFKDSTVETRIDIGTGASLRASDVTLTATAGSVKYANFVTDTLALQTARKTTTATLKGAPQLTFADNGTQADTLTRSAGTWRADGFQPGQLINISGAGANNGDYQIQSLSEDGRVLTIEPVSEGNKGNFANATVAAGTAGVVVKADEVLPEDVPLLSLRRDVNMSLDVGGSLPLVTFRDAGASDTIQRSSGNWASDGFVVGQRVYVKGSLANDGVYRIGAISGDGRTLTLNAGRLLNENPLAGAGGLVTVQGINETVGSILARDLQDTGNLGNLDLLATIDPALGEIDVGLVLGFVNSASAAVNVNGSITASNGVTINATATSNATLGSPGGPAMPSARYLDVNLRYSQIGATYLDAEASATTRLGSGAVINIGNTLSMRSLANNTANDSTTLVAGTRTPQTAGSTTAVGAQAAGAAIAVTYEKARTTASSTVASGASVNAGYALDIDATTRATLDAETRSQNIAPQRNMGQGVGLTWIDAASAATARIDGSASVISGGAGTGVSVTASATNLSNDATSQVSTTGKPNAGKVDNKLTSKQSGAQNRYTPGLLGISAGIVIVDSSLDAVAAIGNGATVRTDTFVKLDANVTDNFKAVAVGGSNAGAEISIGGAVVIADYDNVANASIGDNATVDAGLNLGVNSRATIPNQVTAGQNFVNAAAATQADLAKLLNDLQNTPTLGLDPESPVNSARQSQASAQTYFDRLQADATLLKDDLTAFINAAVPYYNQTSILPEQVATTYALATAAPKAGQSGGTPLANFALSGTVQLLGITNQATSYIGKGARINQDASLRGAGQTINLTSNGNIEVVDISGISTLRSLLHGQNVGTSLSLAGSYIGLTENIGASSYIDDGAVVTAGAGITLSANTKNLAVDMVQSGGQSRNVAISGAVVYNKLSNTATALIENEATVTAGTDLTLSAKNELTVAAIAGTVNQASQVGIGVSVAVNDVTNTALAVIANGNGSTGAKGTVSAGQDVKLSADNVEQLIAIAVAGTVSDPPQSSGSDSQVAPGIGQNGQSASSSLAGGRKAGGVGISGAASLNFSNQNTRAYVDAIAALQVGRDLSIRATGDAPIILALAGPIAIDQNGGSGTVGIAGGFNENDLDRTTFAYDRADTTVGRNATVSATTSDTVVPIAVGAAGQKSTGTAALAGSVNLTLIDSDTRAWVNPDTGTARSTVVGGNLNVAASADLLLVSVAGGFSVGGKFGLGAGVDVSIIKPTVAAFIGNNVSTPAGSISVTARDDTDVVSIAASLGLATNQSGVGLAGSASSQNLTSNVQAWVLPNASIATDGSLLVAADDAINAVVVAGGAGGGRTAGLGASVANVNIGDTASNSRRQVQAYIGAGATVDAKGNGAALSDATGLVSGTGALVSAAAADKMILIGAGGALGNTFAFAASASVETMLSSVDAFVGAGARINLNPANASATQSLIVRADHKTNVLGFAGAIALAPGTAGIGAAADVQVLDRTVRASIDSTAATPTRVAAVDNVIVEATSSQPITSIAIGLSGAGTVALAGSASVIKTTTSTQAYIGDAADVNAASNVVVSAHHNTDFLGIGGAGAIGLNSVGFAATTSTVIENDVTRAYLGVGAFVSAQAAGGTVSVRNGQKNADGSAQRLAVRGVALSATGFEKVQGYAVGGAVGLDAALSGSAPVLVLDTETHAFISRGAQVNAGALPANLAHDVHVLAGDTTTVVQIAGSIAGGGAAVGAAVDVAILTKDTQAYIADAPTAAAGAVVRAQGNVVLQATSSEAIYAGSGSAVAGGASLGGSVGVFLVGTAETPQITRAEIGRHAVVFANRNVGVIAIDKTTIFDVSGTAAFGGVVGIGAAASVPVVNKQTHALIDNDAKVDALGNGDVLVARDGSFTVQYVDFGDGGGYGGNDLPTIINVRPPTVTGESLSCSDALTNQRIATARDTFHHGLIVSATNQDDIEIFAVGGALSGGVAVSLSGAVNVHKVDTLASIGDRAKINLEPGGGNLQSVRVAAGNDFFHLGVGGAISGGSTAGVSPAVDVTVLKLNAVARIGASAQVKAVEDVTVVARNQEEILSIAAGLGVGGLAGVAGTVALIDVDNRTLAYIDTTAAGSTTPTTVTVGGNLDVRASDDTGSYIVAGSAALGVGGGIGVAVGVNDVHKDTRAYIADGVVATAGAGADLQNLMYDGLDPVTGLQTKLVLGITVQAGSSEQTCSIVAAGAAGGFVGLAGGVAVTIVDSDTQAYIGKRAVVSSPGVVAVGAYNKLHINADVGGVGLAGLLGLAGGVDVGVVRSDTQSFIDDGASVTSGSTVSVNALAEKDIDSLAFSGAGSALLGIAGAVSVYSIGSALDADANASLAGNGKTLDASLASQANTNAINARLATFSANAVTAEQKTGIDGARSQTVTRNFAADFRQPVASGTSAHIGSKATVTAADDINVKAKDKLKFNAVTGNGAVGGVAGIGGSVAVVNIGLTDTAWVAPNAVLSVGPDLGHDITVEATLHDSKLNVEAYGGQGGGLALGGQVTVLNDTSRQLAYIDQGVVVRRADHLNVVATADRPATLHAGGVQVGGLAIGASVARANLQGSTIAYIGHDPAAVRPATTRTVVNWLNITADNDSTASVDTFAATVGILAGAGTDAQARVTPLVRAYMNGNNIGRVTYTASITALATDDADARAYGVSVGGIAAGVSLATAVASPDLQAYIGSGAGMTTGRDLIVQSVENYALVADANGTLPAITGGNVPALQRQGTVDGGRHPDNSSASLRNNGAYATAFSATGSLVGGDGATSTADDSAQLYSHIDGGAVINAGGNVSILSLALNDSHALASGVTFGLVAGGGSKTAIATATGSTRAALDGRVAKAVNLDVQALATDTANAVTDATAASVGGAGLNSTSRTTVTPTLVARVGNESFDAGTAVSGASVNLGFVHGYATGQRLVYDNGTPATGAQFSLPSGGGNKLVSGATYYAIVNAAAPTRVQLAATLADAQAGRALQLGAGSVGIKQSLLPPGPNPYATVSGDVHLLAKSFNDGDAAASGLAGSVGISAGLTYAFSTVTPNVKTFLGQGGSITAGGNVVIESQQGKDITLAGNTGFNPATAVNPAGNTVTITGHGFDDGASVTYSRSGGGDIGLADQRSYHVIRVDADTVQLGDSFLAANVNAANSTIGFAGGHGFKSGDEVVYRNGNGGGGGANTGGLLDDGRYFVKVLDPNTVQLFTTQAAALAAPATFSAGNVGAVGSPAANTIALPDGQTLADGTIVTYRLLPADFSDGLVGIGGFNNDGTPIPKANVVYFGTDYLASNPLANGSRIKYQTTNQPLTGLVNGNTYFVINNGDGTIGLSLTAGGPALAFSAAPADHRLGSINFTTAAVGSDATGGFVTVPNLAALNLVNGQALVYQALDGVAIGGLQNNTTYYVVLDATLANGFRLATSASLAQDKVPMFLNGAVSSAHSFVGSGPIGGLTNGAQYRVIANTNGTVSLSLTSGVPTAIALNPTGVFGLQALTPSAIALTAGGGGATQSLVIALKATADATQQSLLADGGGAQLGGGADGVVTAVANAAAYSVIGAGTGSETGITLSPTVQTFLDTNSNVSGSNVQVLSTSNAQTGNRDTNSTGSFIAGTNPYAHTDIVHINRALSNSGVTVNARGNFTLDATAAQGGSLAVSAEAGAGIAVAYANRSGQVLNIRYVDHALVGQNNRITAGGSATVSTRAVTVASASAVASGKGFGAGSRAAVGLTVIGSQLSEVGALTRLTATDVVLDSKVDATLAVNTDAYGGGFATEGYATSSLNAVLSPQVAVRDGAVVTGTASVKVNASNNNVFVQSRAHTTTAGVFAFSIAETNGLLISQPTLIATPAATVATPLLQVTTAPTGIVNVAGINNAVRDVYAIDAGYVKPVAIALAAPINNFNPTVNLALARLAQPGPARLQLDRLLMTPTAAADTARPATPERVKVFDPDLGLFISRQPLSKVAGSEEFARYHY